MSTHIVDRIEAIRFPKEVTGHYADQFIVLELGGDNNLRTTRGNKRCRSWSATAIGMDWEVIGKACRFAGGCAGGMVKLHGRETKPESYIRAYRKALATALTLTESREQRRLTITARIRVKQIKPGEPMDGDERAGCYHAGELLAKHKRTPRTVTQYGTTYDVFDFDLSQPADLKLWLDHCHGNGWDCAEVFGPGEV